MIKFLQGKLNKKTDEFIIVDVNGIGLEIEVPKPLVPRLPEEGSTISLHTYLRFAEDGFSLFGFENSNERDIFELLINTSGLGPRMSMAIISSMPLEDFVQAILDKNVPVLTTIPGIGKKKAEHIILELRDKISLYTTAMAARVEQKSERDELTEAQRSKINDAIEALIALGIKPNEATKAIYNAFKELGANASTTELIKLGLKYK